MSSKLLLSIIGLISVLLMITALPLGHVSAQNGQKEKLIFSPGILPELGTLYVINFSGNANLLPGGISEAATVDLVMNVTSVKTSGVASISLELVNGKVTLGDDTYALTRGTTVFIPISRIDIEGVNKEVPLVLTAFASLRGRLPLSPSDEPVSLVSAKERQSATIQIKNDFFSVKHFTGNLNVITADELAELTIPKPKAQYVKGVITAALEDEESGGAEIGSYRVRVTDDDKVTMVAKVNKPMLQNLKNINIEELQDDVLEGWLIDEETGWKLSTGEFKDGKQYVLVFNQRMVYPEVYDVLVITEEDFDDRDPRPSGIVIGGTDLPGLFDEE